MFIRLSDEFLTIPDAELCRHGELIEQLLVAHHRRHHLVCLPPKMIAHLETRISFGPYAKRVLAIVTRRCQDYGASLRQAQLTCVVIPFSSQRANGLFGKEFYLRAEQLGEWLEQVPHLYVENGASDGLFYAFMLKSGIRHVGGSPDHLTVRPFHGGGSPLGVVIEALVGSNIQGLCVCDRDAVQAVPPYITDSTSEKAFLSLLKLEVIDERSNSNDKNPFFAFDVTDGWGLENYIGPNMLDFYFEHHPQSRASQSDFARVFSKFPVLDEKQMVEWWAINLKSPSQSHEPLALGLKQRFKVTDVEEARCRALAALAMPADAVSFVAHNGRAGRYYKGLMAAFRKDMENETFAVAIRKIVSKAIVALSADDAIQLS